MNAARRALIQRISGVVKPTFQRRRRIFSGSVPLSAARRIQRLQPSLHECGVRQAEDARDELLVEVGHAALDAERHGVAILVAKQAGQTVGQQILEQTLLEVVLRAPVAGVAGASRTNSGRSRRPVERRLRRWLSLRRASGHSTSRAAVAS